MQEPANLQALLLMSDDEVSESKDKIPDDLFEQRQTLIAAIARAKFRACPLAEEGQPSLEDVRKQVALDELTPEQGGNLLIDDVLRNILLVIHARSLLRHGPPRRKVDDSS